MKIICSSCKKVLGVQSPLNQDSEIPAKCPECFQKEKEEASKPWPKPKPGERQDITFESGIKGYLTVANDATKLSLWDLVVSGKTFACTKDRRDSFLEYLEMIDKDQVDVIFFHSISTKIDPQSRKRKKKDESYEPKKDKPDDSIYYNCAVTLPKYHVIAMFDDKAARMEKIVEVIAHGVVKAGSEEYQNSGPVEI